MNCQLIYIETFPNRNLGEEYPAYATASPIMDSSRHALIASWLENVFTASKSASRENVDELKRLGGEADNFSILASGEDAKIINIIKNACQKSINHKKINKLAKKALSLYPSTPTPSRSRADTL